MSMDSEEREDAARYVVVVNHEEQHSIWPAGTVIPQGWREAGKSGPRAGCLAWVREHWTDMTPASLRRA
jgi:MbtH protein